MFTLFICQVFFLTPTNGTNVVQFYIALEIVQYISILINSGMRRQDYNVEMYS